jgi:hypothetical protein
MSEQKSSNNSSFLRNIGLQNGWDAITEQNEF